MEIIGDVDVRFPCPLGCASEVTSNDATRRVTHDRPACEAWRRLMLGSRTWLPLLPLLLGCAGTSEERQSEPPPCYERPWTPEACDGRAVVQVVIICEGRNDPGKLGVDGVWSNAPRPACAPAEQSARADDWCCW